MELNHQIRLCRPFPFRFGFRAISHNMGDCEVVNKLLQKSRSIGRAVRVLVPADCY
jgi:hypothetical protein